MSSAYRTLVAHRCLRGTRRGRHGTRHVRPAGGRRWGARHGYTVTASPGGKKVEVGAATHEVGVTGLNTGTPYTFTVTATYAVGTSPGASTTPIAGTAAGRCAT